MKALYLALAITTLPFNASAVKLAELNKVNCLNLSGSSDRITMYTNKDFNEQDGYGGVSIKVEGSQHQKDYMFRPYKKTSESELFDTYLVKGTMIGIDHIRINAALSVSNKGEGILNGEVYLTSILDNLDEITRAETLNVTCWK